MKKKIIGIAVCVLVVFPLSSISTTANPDAELEVKVVGGLPLPLFFHVVGGIVVNVGDTPVYNLTIIMTVHGGTGDTINETASAFTEEVPPQQAHSVGFYNLYGHGLVTIRINASASNAETVTVIAKGIQMRGFTWVPLSWIRLLT